MKTMAITLVKRALVAFVLVAPVALCLYGLERQKGCIQAQTALWIADNVYQSPPRSTAAAIAVYEQCSTARGATK